jgi:carbamoyl-phosphate synthase large subunit
VESPLITAYAEALGAQLQPRGYVNIQLRMRNDRPVAFEINARVSSSTGFRALAGVNEPELILRRYLLNENPPRPKAKMIAMVRGFSERIVEAAIWKEMVPN